MLAALQKTEARCRGAPTSSTLANASRILLRSFVRGTHESNATVEAQAAFGNYLRTRMASRDRAKCLQRRWAVKDSNMPAIRAFLARVGAPVGARGARERSRLTRLCASGRARCGPPPPRSELASEDGPSAFAEISCALLSSRELDHLLTPSRDFTAKPLVLRVL
jgi:hypothetical protein